MDLLEISEKCEMGREEAAKLLHKVAESKAAWTAQATNPIRSELPPHPYLLPFKENMQDLSYDGTSINLEIFYE
jgi:hypothetical protein